MQYMLVREKEIQRTCSDAIHANAGNLYGTSVVAVEVVANAGKVSINITTYCI